MIVHLSMLDIGQQAYICLLVDRRFHHRNNIFFGGSGVYYGEQQALGHPVFLLKFIDYN